MENFKINKLLTHLRSGKSITGIGAMQKWNLYRLSGAIKVLRDRGWNIKTEMVTTKESTHAKYKLI
jgi:hypothetical protein